MKLGETFLKERKKADPAGWRHVARVASTNPKGRPVRYIIRCQEKGCSAEREVASQDRFQVKRCTPCQTAYKAPRRSGTKGLDRAMKELQEAQKAARDEVAETLKPPKDFMRRESYARRLAEFPAQRRKEILDEAIKNGDGEVVGTVMAFPAWFTDMTKADQETIWLRWAQQHAPDALETSRLLDAEMDRVRLAGTVLLNDLSGYKLRAKEAAQAAARTKAALSGDGD